MKFNWETLHACPICEAPGPFTPTNCCTIRPTEYVMVYVTCPECGGEFHNPMWTRDTIDEWYSSGEYMKVANPAPVLRQMQYAVNYVTFLTSNGVKSIGRFLEFGSGEGHLLREIVKTFGAEVAGIEKDPGRIVKSGAVDSPDGQFDVIAAVHSLEHAPRPLETLRWLVTMLTQDGHVLIEVPVRKGHLCESHPIAFTPDALLLMADLAGLEPRAAAETPRNGYSFIGLFRRMSEAQGSQ